MFLELCLIKSSLKSVAPLYSPRSFPFGSVWLTSPLPSSLPTILSGAAPAKHLFADASPSSWNALSHPSSVTSPTPSQAGPCPSLSALLTLYISFLQLAHISVIICFLSGSSLQLSGPAVMDLSRLIVSDSTPLIISWVTFASLQSGTIMIIIPIYEVVRIYEECLDRVWH